MDKLTSILAVIDPADESRHVVAKAMVLARHFRARVELLPVRFGARLHAAAYLRSGGPAGGEPCLRNRRPAVPESIRRSIAEDVTVTTHVAMGEPALRGHRAPGAGNAAGSRDQERRGPSPAAAIHARRQRLAARAHLPGAADAHAGSAVEPGGSLRGAPSMFPTPATRSLARSILQTAGFSTPGCAASSIVVYSESGAGRSGWVSAPPRRRSSGWSTSSVWGASTSMSCRGMAEDTLPSFAARQAMTS